MKVNNKYFCDDCEIEMDKFNKYGLQDICDDCETFYKLTYKNQMERKNNNVEKY